MDKNELRNTQETPEQIETIVSSGICEVIKKSNGGNRDHNLRAICAALSCVYLSSLENNPEVDMSLKMDVRRTSNYIKSIYTSVPKQLIDGSLGMKPSEEWLLERAMMYEAFTQASEVLEQNSGYNLTNVLLGIVDEMNHKVGTYEKSDKKPKSVTELIAEQEIINRIVKPKGYGSEERSDIITELMGLLVSEKEACLLKAASDLEERIVATNNYYNRTIAEITDKDPEKINYLEGLRNRELEEIRSTPSETTSIEQGVEFSADRCIDYAMLVQPAIILEQIRPYVDSSYGVEILEILIESFSSLGNSVTQGPYYQEHKEFMDDFINVLVQSKNGTFTDLMRLHRMVSHAFN